MPTTKNVTKKTAKKAVKKATKKTTKKAVKKTASKVNSSKKIVRALVCAEGEACFWTTDGRVLENLEQLRTAFGSMDDEVFLHHVNKEKNDFADWVETVLEDAECAAALRRAKKPQTAEAAIVRCLRAYSK